MEKGGREMIFCVGMRRRGYKKGEKGGMGMEVGKLVKVICCEMIGRGVMM